MAKNNFGAGIRFEIQGFNQTVRQFGKMHTVFYTVRQAVRLLDKSYQGLRKSFQVAGFAGEFEQQIQIVGLVSRSTSDELIDLRKHALKLALHTQFTPKEAADGLTALATSGFKARQQMALLRPVLDLTMGSLGKLGVAEAARVAGGAIRAFGIEVEHGTLVVDKLLRITQLTNFQAEDFKTAFSKAAGEMGAFNQSLDDTLILMGLMRNMNIQASVASTAVRNAVRRISGSEAVQNELLDLGVKLINKKTGGMRKLTDIIIDTIAATSKLDVLERNRIATTVFGARGIFAQAGVMKGLFEVVRNGKTVMIGGADAVAYLRKELKNASGTAELFRKTILSTFEGQKKLIKGAIGVLGVELGTSFISVFKPLVIQAFKALQALITVIQAIPKPIKNMIALVTVLALGFAVLMMAIVTVKIAIAGFFLVLKVLGLTLTMLITRTLFFSAVFAGLVGIVVAVKTAIQYNLAGVRDFFIAVGRAIYGTYLVAKNWQEGMSELPVEFANSLKKSGVFHFAVKLGGWIGRLIDFAAELGFAFFAMSKRIWGAVSPVFISMKYLFLEIVGAFGRLSEFLFGDDFINKIEGTKKSIEGISFDGLFNGLTDISTGISWLIDGTKDFIAEMTSTSAFQGVADTFSAIGSVLAWVWNFTVKIGKQLGEAMGPGLALGAEGLRDGFVGVWNIFKYIFKGLKDSKVLMFSIWLVWQGILGAIQVVSFVIGGVIWLVGKLNKWLGEQTALWYWVGRIAGGIMGVLLLIGGVLKGGILGAIYLIGQAWMGVKFVIKNGIGGAIDFLKSKVLWLWDKLKWIINGVRKAASYIPFVKTTSLQEISDIPLSDAQAVKFAPTTPPLSHSTVKEMRQFDQMFLRSPKIPRTDPQLHAPRDSQPVVEATRENTRAMTQLVSEIRRRGGPFVAGPDTAKAALSAVAAAGIRRK